MKEGWGFDDGYAKTDRTDGFRGLSPGARVAFERPIAQVDHDIKKDAVKCSSSFPEF